MTICPTCQQVMLESDGCLTRPDSIPFGQEIPNDPEWSASLPERCHDCETLQGNTHHDSCCVAVCGLHSEQRILCDCDQVPGGSPQVP